MALHPHPEYRDLARRVRRLQNVARPWCGIVYRSATPRYATTGEVLTGQGSRGTGGRWNPAGLAAVYASLAPETALAEALAHFRYYGSPSAPPCREHSSPSRYA